MTDLFGNTGAEFSADRKYRFALWRIWDEQKPLFMFIGLNPSKASEDDNDHTIRRVRKFAYNLGAGGFYMVNCFTYVTPYPEDLIIEINEDKEKNYETLRTTAEKCKIIIFCWGTFPIVRKLGRDKEIMQMFPKAKALGITEKGYPAHPLFLPKGAVLVDYPKI